MEIIKNKIHIGIEKPFTFLHTTDTHITRTDSNDSMERKEFAAERCKTFFPNADNNIDFIKQYVKQTGYQLIHTGDLIDFVTPENLRAAKQFAIDTGLMFVAGNHELHTCPNNVFCEKDFAEDLKHTSETLSKVQDWFENDICFSYKEINGVYLVGINDSDYQITTDSLEALKKLVSFGKPIILFMHIPIFTDELYVKQNGAMLAIPDEIIDNFGAFQIFEQKANDVTKKAVDYIKNTPEIKCVITGHIHYNFESQSTSDVKQLITGLDTIREITVV